MKLNVPLILLGVHFCIVKLASHRFSLSSLVWKTSAGMCWVLRMTSGIYTSPRPLCISTGCWSSPITLEPSAYNKCPHVLELQPALMLARSLSFSLASYLWRVQSWPSGGFKLFKFLSLATFPDTELWQCPPVCMLNVLRYIRHFVNLNYHYYIIIKLNSCREVQHFHTLRVGIKSENILGSDLYYKIILCHLLPATRGC